jgi:hypothetical protein
MLKFPQIHQVETDLNKQKQEKPITLLQFILYNVIGLCLCLLVIMAFYYAKFK